MDALAPLARHLVSRGPIGAALAAYLSSRVDLMSQIEALRLVAPTGSAPATPYAAIDRTFAEETGTRLADAFASFETDPFATGALAQWHRGQLTSGEAVVFKVMRDGVGEQLESEIENLPPSVPKPDARVLDEFERFLVQSLDLRREAEDLGELRDRCEAMSLVTVPEVHGELSGSSFLTVSDLGGSTVAERSLAASGAAKDRGPRVARRLCRAWLRVTLSTGTVPMDPSGRNVLLLEDGKVAFCGGPLHTLSNHTGDQLRRYLAATSIEDYESLVDTLLDLSESRPPKDERRFRHQLRHTAPFRDGGWDSDSDTLSRAVLAHWHRAEALGFRSSEAMLAFRFGLAVLSRQAEVLAPGENSFQEAFQELRLYELFAESTRLSTIGEAAQMSDLPRRLDRGLTVAADSRRRSRPQASEELTPGSWRMVTALLMSLAALVLLVHHVGPPAGGSGWVESIGAVGVLLLGGLLLRFAAD